MAPMYFLVRFLVQFPLVALGAAIVVAGAWVFLAATLGEAATRSAWPLILLFGLVTSWQSLLGKHGLGRGPTRFRALLVPPSADAWGGLVVMFRGFFWSLYGFYVVMFWVVLVLVLWLERAAILRFAIWGT